MAMTRDIVGVDGGLMSLGMCRLRATPFGLEIAALVSLTLDPLPAGKIDKNMLNRARIIGREVRQFMLADDQAVVESFVMHRGLKATGRYGVGYGAIVSNLPGDTEVVSPSDVKRTLGCMGEKDVKAAVNRVMAAQKWFPVDPDGALRARGMGDKAERQHGIDAAAVALAYMVRRGYVLRG